MKFWHNITTKIYYKYLVPLLCIMAIAMLLGGILIFILVSNNMDKTGTDIKVQTEKDLIQDIQFKHNAYTKNSSNQFEAELENIVEQLVPLTTAQAFKQLNYSSIQKEVDSLVATTPRILEFKIIRSNGYATYAHCEADILYSKDLKKLRPSVIFNQHEVFKNSFISKAYVSDEENTQYIYIGLPLLVNLSKEVEHGIIIRYDLTPTIQQLQKVVEKGGGSMYILNTNNELVAQSWKTVKNTGYQKLTTEEKELLKSEAEGNFWEDKLFSFHKNKYGYITVLDTPNKLAYTPIKKRLLALSAQFDSTTFNILFFTTLAFLLIAILATYIGVRVARSITHPVTLLTRATRKVAHGNLNVQINAHSKDELGELSQSFNQMVKALKNYRHELQEHSKKAEVQREKLAASNANLEQYARTVSHDLKEPLRMISSYVQLLQRRYQHLFDDNANDYMNFTLDGAKRMGQIIEDLLSYARFEQKAQHKTFEVIDLNEVLEAAIHNLQWQIQENNATISYGKLPSVKGKYTYLLQVFQNLLSNAIKYRRDEDPSISISAQLDNNAFTFVVKDNGTGMAKEDLERIFMPFTRLVSRQEAEGNGIGLATVKKIITHHSGHIWVESEEGVGSTFYFSLPSTPMQLEANVRAVA